MPSVAHANIIFSEIMYDLDGSDTDREWVEIFNDGPNAVTIKGGTGASWRFNDGSNNRILSEPPEYSGRGSMTLQSGEYAVIARDPTTFYSMYPSGTFTVMRAALTLNNTGASILLIDDAGNIANSATYANSTGANDDGNSLQKNSSGNWIAALPTPGTGILSSQPSSGVSSSSTSSSTTETSYSGLSSGTAVDSPSSTDTASNWPVEPQVFADAGKDKIVVSGATARFEGKAYGLKKEPLNNARYIWNFGDGATAEGKTVEHIYHYPGDYIVILDIASGYFSGSDRANVRAEPSPLSITSIGNGKDYFEEIYNSSNSDLEISYWQVFLGPPAVRLLERGQALGVAQAGEKIFTVPKNTFIAGGKKMIFSNEITGLSVEDGSAPELRYPNGVTAYKYGEAPKVAVSPSFPKTASSKESQTVFGGDGATYANKPALKENASADEAVGIGGGKNEEDSNNLTASAANSNSGFNYKWLLGVVGISAISVAGIFLARRFELPEDEADKIAKEIEIVEE